MNIVYTVDDKYIPQLATGILSVCMNNESENITFYVISKGVTDANKEKLVDWVLSLGQKIEIIELYDVSRYIDFEFDTSSWNDIVLARLVLDKLLPNGIDRVLYLDADTLVRRSLTELWNTDLEDHVLAASIEPTADKERKSAINLSESDPYFNAGILLINMNKWREINAGKRVLDFYKAHNGVLFSNDQCAINGALKDYILNVSIGFNFCNTYRFYPYKALVKIASPVPFLDQEDFIRVSENPTIIHFLGEERPWRIGNQHPYTDEYLAYWTATPWGDAPFETGWETYFKAFYLFNAVMKPFPLARYQLINKLIPYMIKHRKKS